MACSFSQILGQNTAKQCLEQVVSTGKIPHAYLFTGISGIGKTSTAMAFAMAMNCPDSEEMDGCGRCPSCRQLMGGNFPDFLSIYPDKQNISINQIKDLNHALGFAPMSGTYRFILIHQAETMTDEAANSFLKTLEEPPANNILILKVKESLDLLPTIVSRCQKVPFKPLSSFDIRRWLIENRGLDRETAMLLSSVSEGSLGRAISMLDGDFLDKRRKWLSLLIKIQGISGREVITMVEECAAENRKSGLDSPGGTEAGMLDLLTVWFHWYRDLLLLRVGGAKDLLINIDFFSQLKKMAAGYEIKRLILGILSINRAQADIRHMRNVNLVFEQTILKLSRLAE